MKRIGSMIAAGLIALSALPALAQQTGAAPPPDHFYHRHFMGHGFLGPLVWIIVIFGLVALFSRFGLWGRRHYRYRGMGGSALDILEERFARGEIDQAEFEAKRKLLMR